VSGWRAEIEQNTLSGGDYGISATRLYTGGTFEVKSNSVRSARTAGIKIFSFQTEVPSVAYRVVDNHISSNLGTGLQIEGYATPLVIRKQPRGESGDVRDRSVHDETRPLQPDEPGGRCPQQLVGGATNSEMDANPCPSNIKAIYDFWDQGTSGLVTYCPRATSPTPVIGEDVLITLAKVSGGAEVRWTPTPGKTYDAIREIE
jgi:hypothetical protein